MKNNNQKMLFEILHDIAAVCFLAATVVTVINVILRYIFRTGIVGSEELATTLVLVLAVIMFPIMENDNEHLCIDLFNTVVKNEKVKTAVMILRGLVTIFIFGVLVYFGYKATMQSFTFGHATPTLHLPKFILYLITAVSYLCFIVTWILKFIYMGRKKK